MTEAENLRVADLQGEAPPGTTVPVKPGVLEWAMRQARDADAVRRQFPSLFAWMNGIRQPTMRELEAFAEAVPVPFGFLMLDQPPAYNLTEEVGVRIRVRETGEVLGLGEFARRFCPKLVYCDIEGVYQAVGDSRDLVLLDECGNWEGIDAKQYELVVGRKEVQ